MINEDIGKLTDEQVLDLAKTLIGKKRKIFYGSHPNDTRLKIVREEIEFAVSHFNKESKPE